MLSLPTWVNIEGEKLEVLQKFTKYNIYAYIQN